MAGFPNPFRGGAELKAWQEIRIGGRLIKALLIKVNGNKVEDDWQEQRGTDKSGARYIFKGTKPAGPFELTFESTNEDSFDDLREIYDLLAPSPVRPGIPAGTPKSTPNTPPSSGIGSGSAGATMPNTGSLPMNTTKDGFPIDTSKPGVGPKPPTLSVENAHLLWLGVTSISRKAWEGPTNTATNSWQVKMTVIPQQDLKPANTGPASPTSPDPKQSPANPNQVGAGASAGGGGGGGIGAGASVGAGADASSSAISATNAMSGAASGV